MHKSVALLCLAVSMACGGCAVERTLTVRSNPPDALVWLNDQEIGRTPVTRRFTWYGTYDVEVRKEGYETLKTKTYVGAPWWQWVPFDLVADLTPGRKDDHHDLAYTLEPASTQPVDAQALLGRGEQLRTRLESGERTRVPDTGPAPARPPKKNKKTGVSPATAPAVEPTTTPEPQPDTSPATEPAPDKP